MQLLLDSGSGGRASQRLIADIFVRHFDNAILRRMDDAAVLPLHGPAVMSTDGYTVTPLEFPGGNIGTLAVHGTVNDVSMMGARPLYLSCASFLKRGWNWSCWIALPHPWEKPPPCRGSHRTGDTKVVPRGTCDKMFITTAGLGRTYCRACAFRLACPPGRRRSDKRQYGRSRTYRHGKKGKTFLHE